jgi:type IV pilus assembly protein PilQ
MIKAEMFMANAITSAMTKTTGLLERNGMITAVRWARYGAMLSTLLACGLLEAANLTNVNFTSLPGGRFEAKLDFDDVPPNPTGYTIEKPARIALDLPGVTSQLSQKKHALSDGNANSAVFLESGGKTRMILNLVQLAPYTTRVEGNSLFVELGASGAQDYLKATADNQILAGAAASKAVASMTDDIVDVDFKRGAQGEGELHITLGNPSSEVSVVAEGGKIKLNLRGARLPERFQRRFDVKDFATPVMQFDAKSTAAGSEMIMTATGSYDYLAYQADNKYVVSVKPLTEEEEKQRKKDFAYTGDKLSLNFQDIEVRAVLQLIADFTELNLVASDTVSGRITLRLQNVPWDQALELVLKTKGLDKRQIGNVLMVAPAAELAERERQELDARKQVEELAPLQTEYVQVRYAKAKDLFELFKGEGGGEGDGGSTNSILSSRGSVIVDERTNSLLITETAQKLEEFRRLVKLIDIPVRQVLIESRIVIANSNFDESLGVRWGGAFISRNEGDGSLTSTGGLNSTTSLLEQQTSGDPREVVFPDALAVDLGSSLANSANIAIGYADNNKFLALELSALEARGQGEVVSQPKVITGDKQQATIKSGREIPYQESSANGETTISFKEAVLKLDVTPNITPDDRIIMDLIINKDNVGADVTCGFGCSVPSIDTTELTTQVLVGNGQTVVLGGVFSAENRESVEKVPFLGDIPYVGRLFRRDTTKSDKVETLIFITPRILADNLID